MRWKTKEPPVRGEVRTRKVFAWKRTEVGEFTVWLEFYAINEMFCTPVGGDPGWWHEQSRHTLDYYC